MTKDESIDVLVQGAIASMCQPQRCEAIIRALSDLAKGKETDATFPELVFEVGADGRRSLARLCCAGVQSPRIAELELIRAQDETEIRQLKACRFEPAERAVLDACAEMMLIPENGRVRVPNERDIELVGEAEWAKRQEHQIADREEGLDYVRHPVHGGPVLRGELKRGNPASPPQEHRGVSVKDVLATQLRELERTRNLFAREVLDWEISESAPVPDDLPLEVRALVARYRGYPIDACERCGSRAPLKSEDETTAEDESVWVCAWGCDVHQ